MPQFLLDSWIEAGRASECNIICTQPRRISAMGLAERVAAERCERGVGEVSGGWMDRSIDRRVRPVVAFVDPRIHISTPHNNPFP